MLLSSNNGQHKDDIKAQGYNIYSDEERLSEILSKVNGAGDVSVMITYYGTTSYDVAFEKKQNNSSSERETTKSEEDTVVTSGGTPLVKGEVYPRAKGVVIIAEGAGISSVKKALTDAASAALEVAPCRVCVLEGKERN